MAAEISTAQNEVIAAVTGDVPGNHIQASVDALNAAITAAQAATSTDDTAVITLTNAVSAFNTVGIVGPSNVFALNIAQNTAQGLITANAPGSTFPGQHVVGSLATLIAALAAANATSTNAQWVINGQTDILNSAIAAYNAAIVPQSIILTTAENTDGSLSAITAGAIESAISNGVDVSVDIPAGTVVTGPSSWDGTLTLPEATTTFVAPTPNSGYTASAIAAIAVGAGDTPLTFDHAARLLFAGQTGNFVGWSQAGVFTPITNICSADSQTVGDALPAGGDCKFDNGTDLVVWTEHFTTFIAYTQTSISVTGVSNSNAITGVSGGGSGGGEITSPVSSPLRPEAAKVDANKDNKIDFLDFNILMVNWGMNGVGNPADFNGDGIVDILDFNYVMIYWTP